MKKIQVLVLLSISCFSYAFAQCTPDPLITQVGLSPADSTLDCVERGVYYDAVIHFKNFDQILSTSVGFPPPATIITIISVRLDSVTNVPSGLSFECDDPDCMYSNSENGCVRVRGITNDSPGDYYIGFYAEVVLDLGSGPPFTITADSQLLADAGLSYKFKVIEPGSVCSNTFMSGPLSVSTTANPDTCAGDTIMLVASANGGTPPWTFNWSPGANLSNTSVSNPLLYPTNPGLYSVTVFDNFGSTATASYNVTYKTPPVVTITSDTTVCPGSSLQLLASGGSAYSWSPDSSLSSSMIANPVAIPLEPTVYKVTVEDMGCEVSDSVNVALDERIPQAGFEFVKTGLTVTFTSSGFSSNADEVKWDFDDGNGSELPNTSHTFGSGGIYHVTLIVSTPCLLDTITKTVDLSGVSARSIAIEDKLTLFPNPTRGMLYFELKQVSALSVYFTLHNIHGEEILKDEFENGGGQINLNYLPKGVYFLFVKWEENTVVKKILVN